ncbi:MAG TPA: BMP family ABC transporter substrate-binding protein [Pyrinomonadaceae bacterium]|nr:BMP family ABC transporter substrate-binding protein [Pyrinomonadaceae bacterium]
MRLRLLASLILCLSVLPFTSCQTQGRAEADKSKVHVGVVFDIGGKDDRSFNAAAWEGAKHAAEELPIVLRDVEPGDPTSIEPAMRAFAERGYDLIIGVGFAQTPIMQQVAKDYPNLSFAIIDGAVPPEEQLPNVAYLLFKEHQGSYLVGMIAARKSQTGTLGFIGGMDIPLIHKFATGYEEGARAVNPNVRVITNFVGVTDAAWNNPGKGKELALAQIGKGADIIFTAAGNSGLGAFDAVEQNNKFVIGVDSNQNWVKPGHVLTSMVKRVDTAVYQTVKDKVNNAFKGGVHVYGLENDGISYALDKFNEALIPSEVLREVDAAKQKIIGGEIQVTDAMAK